MKKTYINWGLAFIFLGFLEAIVGAFIGMTVDPFTAPSDIRFEGFALYSHAFWGSAAPYMMLPSLVLFAIGIYLLRKSKKVKNV
ncbi:DUF3169 family protein [Lactococcus termiticola]|uniref:Uncharacterized protein n=1 Tax=Lactococcus termiticola TaxID=2169526 RepID=A0A2R5HDD5_9LACT|nr:DUF3169 family protein [Lactococcus termiticola]GBG96087.1 hypothetical protein NtB2_00191 [Lactococcus termiticola]